MASRAPAAAPAPPAAGKASPPLGGFNYGAMARRGGDADNKAEGEKAPSIQTIGSKTFYHRGQVWVDSAVDAKMEKKAKKIERYSREYFALIDKHGKDAAKYLAIEGDVIFVLDGKVYKIVDKK